MTPSERPWYLRAFVAVCAWFTAFFFLFWILLIVKSNETGLIILGVLLLVGGSLVGRASMDADFIEHAALACTLAGRGTMAFGISQMTHSLGVTCAIMGMGEVLWFSLHPGFLSRVISGLYGFAFFGFFLEDAWKGTHLWAPLLITGILVLLSFVFVPEFGKDDRPEIWRPLGWAAALGFAAWALAAGDWSYGGMGPSYLHAAVALQALLLCGFAAWLLRTNPSHAVLYLPLLVALAWCMRANPSVLAAMLLGLAAFHSRQSRLLAVAGGTLLAGVVSYYYHLHDTLLYKSGVLALSGVLFAVAAIWLVGTQGKGKSFSGLVSAGKGRARALAAVAVFALTAGYLDVSAQFAEAKKSTGDVVYLQLRPRDPRDPLMGDYMAVNFQICNDISNARFHQPSLDPTGYAYARPDEKNVLRFISLDQGASGMAGNVRIGYQASGPQVSIGTTKVYFQEGDEPRFRNARYGRFKLQSDGTLTWLGFAGEHFEDLGAPKAPVTQ